MMGGSFLTNPAIFLIDTLFSLYIFALMLRFLLQWVEADFYNPISQALIKITHPPLRLLRRVIPSIGRIDSATVVMMLGLQMLTGYLIFLLQDVNVGVASLAVWAIGQLIDLLFNVFFFAIIARALLSWFNPMPYSPASTLLTSLTEPLLRGARRWIPAMGGIDLSPIVVLIAIQFTKMLINQPLQQLMAMVD